MKIFTILSKFVHSPESVQWRVTSFGITGSLIVMLFGPQNTWAQPKITTAINCNSVQHVCLNPKLIITRRC
jgi:hypothetical protein